MGQSFALTRGEKGREKSFPLFLSFFLSLPLLSPALSPLFPVVFSQAPRECYKLLCIVRVSLFPSLFFSLHRWGLGLSQAVASASLFFFSPPPFQSFFISRRGFEIEIGCLALNGGGDGGDTFFEPLLKSLRQPTSGEERERDVSLLFAPFLPARAGHTMDGHFIAMEKGGRE